VCAFDSVIIVKGKYYIKINYHKKVQQLRCIFNLKALIKMGLGLANT